MQSLGSQRVNAVKDRKSLVLLCDNPGIDEPSGIINSKNLLSIRIPAKAEIPDDAFSGCPKAVIDKQLKQLRIRALQTAKSAERFLSLEDFINGPWQGIIRDRKNEYNFRL